MQGAAREVLARSKDELLQEEPFLEKAVVCTAFVLPKIPYSTPSSSGWRVAITGLGAPRRKFVTAVLATVYSSGLELRT